MAQEVTVRELGGEIWAEIAMLRNNDISPFDRLDQDVLNNTIDLITAVLARHAGAVIINDPGMPVTPRPVSQRRLS